MTLRFSAAAAQDLSRLYLHGLESFGPLQADRYYDRLLHSFDLIAANPLIAPERTAIFPRVRVHPFAAHIIVYEVDDEGVTILRVRHRREDWLAGLRGAGPLER